MKCKSCGNQHAYAVRTEMYHGVLTEVCDACALTAIAVNDPSTVNHISRITEKVTKNLNSKKHVYVPPKNEGSVGGIYNKEG